MKNKPEGGSSRFLAIGGVAMVVCCAAPLIVASGALAGFGAWLFDGGFIWLVLAVALAGLSFFSWHRRASSCETPLDHQDSDAT